MKKKPIRIKPENKGLLHKETGTKPGQKIPMKKIESIEKNGTKAEKKRAVFAENARKWKKK